MNCVQILLYALPTLRYALKYLLYIPELQKEHIVIQNLHQPLSDVILSIPLKKRIELSTQIQLICQEVGLRRNFLVNQLSLDNPERRAKLSATTALKRLSIPKYWIYVEGFTSPEPHTLAEAAKKMGVTETSLKVRVSANRSFEKDIVAPLWGKTDLLSGHYICTKMTLEEYSEQLRIFNDCLHREALQPKSDIQSVSPTHP